MRTRASSISERRLSERLPVPAARDEIGRLGKTLNEMLARIERGMDRERRFVADASHELRSPLALLRAEVELALDLPRGEQELRAALRSIGEEADRVSQLAEDLLLLARLDEGRLPLREEPLEDAVEIHVTDEGAGFPDGFAPTAFERFTRADTARAGPGTGLGLAIVNAIAQAHGGHATITTTNAGADVRLSLPQQPRARTCANRHRDSRHPSTRVHRATATTDPASPKQAHARTRGRRAAPR